MDRVGGYLDYLALRQDVRAFDDVLIAMSGEASARTIERQRAAIAEEQAANRGR